MPRRRAMAEGTTPALPTLPPKGPQDTQTAWEDLWEATKEARQALASTRTPYGQGGGVLPDEQAVGHQITQEINADPAEVKRLRRARKNAHAGKTYPRHSDTK
jgi:hypothetical protein